MFTVPQTIITDDDDVVVGGERDATSLYHSDVMSLGLIWSLEKRCEHHDVIFIFRRIIFVKINIIVFIT